LGQLRTQKLAVGVGIALGAGLTLAAVGAAVLAGAGDGSTTTTRARTAAAGRATYTLRWGDVVRDPRTGTRCEATGEGGLPSLYCTHTARGRYAAVFWNDELQVYGPGSQEMTPTYSFPWWRRLRR
jgi:hypothetical protein